MAPANPIEALLNEHSYIIKVVKALEVIGHDIEAQATIDEALLSRIIAFMREFTDVYHHAREEKLLFPIIVRDCPPEIDNLVSTLLDEHNRGRNLVKLLEKGIERSKSDFAIGSEVISAAINGITGLYPKHISQENDMLYPMAEKLLAAGELDCLWEDFEAKGAYTGIHEKHKAFALDLEKRFGKL